MLATKKKLTPSKSRMTRLCDSFPSLRDKPGTSPWDPHEFARWAGGPARTSGSGAAAAFVLSVWGGVTLGIDAGDDFWNEAPYHVGKFDLIRALGVWDESHRNAFIRWCQDPFWP